MSKVSTRIILSDDFISLPDSAKLLYFTMLFLFGQESHNDVSTIVCKRITGAEQEDINHLINSLFLHEISGSYSIIRNEEEREALMLNMSDEERARHLDYKESRDAKN